MQKNTSSRKPPFSLVFLEQGVARIKGTRLSVAQIVSTWRQNDSSLALTAEYLEIPKDIVEGAINYYQNNGTEIDREIDLREEAAGKRH